MRNRILLSGLLAAAFALQAAGAFFDSAGVRIHYVVEGEGAPVVLLHGLSGSFERNWVASGAIGAVSGKYRVIGMDMRGHGKSDKPRDPKQYGTAIAEDVIRLLDHLKIAKAHVAGYSMGGRVTAYLMVEHPGRLLSAVVAGAGSAGPDLAERRNLMERLAESLEQGKGAGPLLQSLTPPGVSPTPEQIAAANKMVLASNDPLVLAAVARTVMDLERPEAKLRACRVPVLIVAGDLDPRKADAERLKGLLPKAELVLIPEAHHASTPFAPQFKDALRSFLEKW